MDKLQQIIQKYIGTIPKDVNCYDWTDMQSEMESELRDYAHNEKIRFAIDVLNKVLLDSEWYHDLLKTEHKSKSKSPFQLLREQIQELKKQLK